MSGAERIAEERHRQVALGWSRSHDEDHATGELVRAAIEYADLAQAQVSNCVPGWPWEPETWKPSTDPIRNLEKAGALIAAEIDRLLAAPVVPRIEGDTNDG